MSEHLPIHLLERSLAGALPPEEASRVDAHLEGCAICRERIVESRSSREAFLAKNPPRARVAALWETTAPSRSARWWLPAVALVPALAVVVVMITPTGENGPQRQVRSKGDGLGFVVLRGGEIERGGTQVVVSPGDQIQPVVGGTSDRVVWVATLDAEGRFAVLLRRSPTDHEPLPSWQADADPTPERMFVITAPITVTATDLAAYVEARWDEELQERQVPAPLRTDVEIASLLITLLGQDNICENCVKYTLEAFSNKLQGSSLQFPGYDVSIILPEKFLKQKLTIENIKQLIEEQDIRGEFIFPNGQTTEIKYSIIPYKNSTTIFMKTSNGWYPWDKIKIENNKLIFSYDYWYRPPADEVDLKILDLCFKYLNNPKKWNNKDDRICDDDKNTNRMSLFCAVKLASIKITKEYNHRNAVIQTMRIIIDELVPDNNFKHTIMDYNNSPTTTHKDIIKILELTKDRLNKELSKKLNNNIE